MLPPAPPITPPLSLFCPSSSFLRLTTFLFIDSEIAGGGDGGRDGKNVTKLTAQRRISCLHLKTKKKDIIVHFPLYVTFLQSWSVPLLPQVFLSSSVCRF
ncbi:uncharacterized protein V6R79_019451 [Siganus canaliculatus]